MSWHRPAGLGGLYFGIVFAVGFALGTIRTLFLVPRIGETGAVAIELPILLIVAWIVCGRLLRGHRLTPGQAAVMGVVAFVLLMAAEAGLSIALAGRTLSEHLALYREPAHWLGLSGQVAFALFPVLRR